MTRTFQDRNFLVWEVYSSGGRHGYPDNPHVIFRCMTQPAIRSRWLKLGDDEAEAQRLLAESADAELLAMLERAPEIA